MRLNILQKILLVYFIGLFLFWCNLHFILKSETSFYNYFFSFLFSLVPLVCGFFGMFFSKSWGWLKSSVGRSVFFVSLGSFCWGAGSMGWSYYNFFKNVSMPYPSWADVGFLAASLFWIIGAINLSKPSGARSGSKHANGKVLLLLIPTVVIAFSYYFLVTVARGGVLTSSLNDYLKLFFDLAYPISDVIILTISLIIFSLSMKYLGGKYKITILTLLMGFVAMYFADFTFSYTTTIGTFFNGDFGDLLFATALFLISFSTLGFWLSNKSEV